MSRWRNGCDASIEVYVPRGYGYKPMQVRCGSTAFDGGTNQCEACATQYTPPLPHADEGDLEYFERTESRNEY